VVTDKNSDCVIATVNNNRKDGHTVGDDLLSTIAEVAVTLAGFSGVIFALGNRAGGKLTAKEESGLTHMLLTSFGPVLISLFALLMLKSGLVEDQAWRISCAVTGVFCFTGSTKAMIDELKGRHSLPKVIAWAAPIGAQILGTANLGVACGYLVEKADVVLEATLIYLLWISISYFISLLKQDQSTT
jgi:hypothetical protein